MAQEGKNNITSLIAECSGYSKIIVLGLQRSGTHIASEIVSKELGNSMKLYKERMFGHTSCEIGTENKTKYSIEEFMEQQDNYVLQAPSLLYKIEEIHNDTLVIFVNRNLEEIRKSRKRSEWPGTNLELLKYDDKDKYQYYKNPNDLVDMQKEYWDNYQKDRIKNLIEFDFKKLSEHDFWLNRTSRSNFEIGQTKDNGNWINDES